MDGGLLAKIFFNMDLRPQRESTEIIKSGRIPMPLGFDSVLLVVSKGSARWCYSCCERGFP
jgi:hypothetical protein